MKDNQGVSERKKQNKDTLQSLFTKVLKQNILMVIG